VEAPCSLKSSLAGMPLYVLLCYLLETDDKLMVVYEDCVCSSIDPM
jgi:hypothetical protein